MKFILILIVLLSIAGLAFSIGLPILKLGELANDIATSTQSVKEVPKKVENDLAQNIKKEIDALAKTVKDLKAATLLPPPPLPPKPVPLPPAVKSADIYAKALKAVVNIFCYDQSKRVYIMGSGAIIHPSGYVLTNGHVAEHFNDPDTQCSLRRGSPARDFAKARVFWLPSQSEKLGGGEVPKNDAAILQITSTADGSDMSNFEYFKLDTGYTVKDGETLYSLNYPTEFLGSETAIKNTNLVFSLGTVESLVTLDSDASNAEGAYLKGELSAQHGSSGGIFLDRQNGEIAGIFVGLTEGTTTADRKQFMFLSSYVEQIMKNSKGLGIYQSLSLNP